MNKELIFLLLAIAAVSASLPSVIFPTSGLVPSQVAVVVNENDAQSIDVGAYYVRARKIPSENVINLNFSVVETLSPDEFSDVFAQLTSLLPNSIQALALTWLWPYAVGCQSVTSAFSLGYNASIYCSPGGDTCGALEESPYFNSTSSAPFSDFGFRISMSIAAWTTQEAMLLIDRGIQADGTYPRGTGYMVVTSDSIRSVRSPDFMTTAEQFNASLADTASMLFVDCPCNPSDCTTAEAQYTSLCNGGDVVTNLSGIMFYFQSLAVIDGIGSNTYLPGAVGDSLTSFSGIAGCSMKESIRFHYIQFYIICIPYLNLDYI